MKKFLSLFLILMLTFSLCNVSAENKDIAEVHVLLDQKGLFISADMGVLPQSTVLTATKIETAEGIQKLNTNLENIMEYVGKWVFHSVRSLDENDMPVFGKPEL